MRILIIDDQNIVENWVEGNLKDLQTRFPMFHFVASTLGQVGQLYNSRDGSFTNVDG